MSLMRRIRICRDRNGREQARRGLETPNLSRMGAEPAGSHAELPDPRLRAKDRVQPHSPSAHFWNPGQIASAAASVAAVSLSDVREAERSANAKWIPR